MAQTHALTRNFRPSPVLNKTARQMVPPFVQKLYEFVLLIYNYPLLHHISFLLD